MSEPTRIYLDNAATSWPKPESVHQAVENAMRNIGAAAGRSVYREAVQAEQLVEEARRRIAELLGVRQFQRIVFTANGTDSLNTALYGVLRAGDHVVTSVAEHNSTLRPLYYLEDSRQVTVSRVPCNAQGLIDPDDIQAAVTPRTRLISLLHASNVTGAIQPIEEVARFARQRDLLLLVDAAQSLGHIPINAEQIGIDLIAAPGHKGLLGPLGTGVLYVGPRAEPGIVPFRQGGAGGLSHERTQPAELPHRLEAGNLNVPGIAGLAAGVAFLQEQTITRLRRHELELTSRLLAQLTAMQGVTVFGPPDPRQRVGVVSLNLDGFDCQEASALLDAHWGIQTRAGLHCAPLMHESLGTLAKDGRSGGTLRISLGPFTTVGQIDAACQAIGQMSLTQS